MSKPYIHSLSSVKKFKGSVSDYLPIHNLLDSSKGAICDNRHRALTHTSWFLSVILEKIFGVTITNSDGLVVSTRDIGEQHLLEDFKGRFIPTAQDYLQNIEFQDWMQNGNGYPPSYQGIKKSHNKKNKSLPQTIINDIVVDGSPLINTPFKLPFGGQLID